MSISIEFNNACATHFAIDIYKKYKDAFGNIVFAEMNYDKLTLTNDKGAKMYFDGELTAGYNGEGPNGTFRILKMAGFNIEEKYVHENSSFTLSK